GRRGARAPRGPRSPPASPTTNPTSGLAASKGRAFWSKPQARSLAQSGAAPAGPTPQVEPRGQPTPLGDNAVDPVGGNEGKRRRPRLIDVTELRDDALAFVQHHPPSG